MLFAQRCLPASLLALVVTFTACSTTTSDDAVAKAPRERADCVEVTGSSLCHRTDRTKPAVTSISGQDIRDAGATIGGERKAGPSGN